MGYYAYDADMNAMIPVEPVVDGEDGEFTAIESDPENMTAIPCTWPMDLTLTFYPLGLL